MEEYTGPREGLAWLAYLSRNPEAKEQAWDEHEVPYIIFGAVPGGTTKASVMKADSKKFHEDMYAFEDAAKQGLKPRKVSKKAAKEAEVFANAGSIDTSTGAGITKFNEEVTKALGTMGDYD